MHTPLKLLAILLIPATLSTAVAAADPPRVPGLPPPAPLEVSKAPAAPDSARPGTVPLDALKVSPGTVIVLYDPLKGILNPTVVQILLSPQDYQKLMEQSEQFQRQAQAEKLETPSSCKWSGQVEGDLVRIHALIEFRTDRDRALVSLGGKRAWPIAARLDGELPWIQAGDNGLIVQADKAGVHQVTLDLLVPLGTRKGAKGAERGFDLYLPRAAITTLQHLDLPGGVTEVRLGDRTLHPRTLGPHSRLEEVPLGAVDHLNVAWKGPAAEPAKGTPVLAATGHVVVTVSESQVITRAELRLRVLHGETTQWRIQVPLPPEASLEVEPDEPRILESTRSADKQNPVWTIRLREPLTAAGEPLRVTLHLRQPRSGSSVGIVPFTVLDALSQNGDLEILAPDDLRLRYTGLRADVSPREVTDDQRHLEVRAAFGYWTSPEAAAKQPASPLLTLQVEAARGTVETHVTQQLRLLDGDGPGLPRWQVRTRIDVTPIRAGLDRLDVTLPPAYTYERQAEADPPEAIEEVVADPTNHVAQIRLAQKQRRPFSITLVGTLPQAQDEQTARLLLPRPVAWLVERRVQSEPSGPAALPRSPVEDRGGQVNVVLPEGLELTSQPFRAGPATSLLANGRSGPHEYSWQTETTPERLELAWRTYRPQFAVEAVADLVLAGRRARVRQEFRFPKPPSSPVVFRVPAEIERHVRIVEGGTAAVEDGPFLSAWAVTLTGPGGVEHPLVLEYSFPLPDVALGGKAPGPAAQTRLGEPPITVPFVEPLQATLGQLRVRIWCDPGAQVTIAGGRWEELPTEPTERKRLPDLVLRGNLKSPLTLHLRQSGAAPLATAVLDRALIRVVQTESGTQSYRVRFLLSKLGARHLDIDLPAALASSSLTVSLDGKVPPLQLLNDARQAGDVGRRVRLQVEPDLYRQPVVLDLSYSFEPRPADSRGTFQATFKPPQLVDAVLLGRVRWQVELPARWIALYPQAGYTVEQRWGWSGWLIAPLAPRPAATGAELDGWFTAEEAPGTVESEPSLVCWQTALGPFQLVEVPQQWWMLLCSLTVLALGIGLFLLRLGRTLFWICLGAAVAAVAVVGSLLPGTLSVILYGCEPGALVLVLFLGIHWLLHTRYRRQVIFMPGFTRLKPGSSLARAAAAGRPREPSTVDHPPKRGSSIISEVRPQTNGQ
jgi:hypothetical protein